MELDIGEEISVMSSKKSTHVTCFVELVFALLKFHDEFVFLIKYNGILFHPLFY